MKAKVETWFKNKLIPDANRFKVEFQFEANGGMQMVPCNLYTLVYFVGQELPTRSIPDFGIVEGALGGIYRVEQLTDGRYLVEYTDPVTVKNYINRQNKA